MFSQPADFLANTADGARAQEILGKCVHCGFCTATCPTYQLLGDELDGPRGRIYQIKEIVEGATPTRNTQRHLDRCLTCLNCETTCPSGVRYGQLLDIGKRIVDAQIRRPLPERWLRRILLRVLPHRRRIAVPVRLGQLFRPLLPPSLRAKVYPRRAPGALPSRQHTRKMLLLEGCAQPSMAPNINAAARRVLDKLGISIIDVPAGGCCGAASYHSGEPENGLDFMRELIDAWWPHIEAGAEAIVMTASGCGATVKEYGDILRNDPLYAAKAKKVSALCKDLIEVLSAESLQQLAISTNKNPIAFHPPCTLQHAQKLSGHVESLLEKVGFTLLPVADKHLCCGSAGTYSLFQPTLAKTLRDQKLETLEKSPPKLIATANIGCMIHLQGGTDTPVVHWVEMLDAALKS